MTRRPSPLDIGDVIHGFAFGVFGRDHHECVRVEAVGPDWIVARAEPDKAPLLAAGTRELTLLQQARDEPCPIAPCLLRGRRATNRGAPLTTWGHAATRQNQE